MSKANPDPKKTTREPGIIQKRGRNGKVEWYARIVRRDATGKKRQFLLRADNKTEARRLRNQLAIDYETRGADTIYQMFVQRWIYPLEAIIVAFILAIVPYLCLRGLVNRVVSLFIQHPVSAGKIDP